MTWNCHGERVCGTGPCNRPYGSGNANPSRNSGIARCVSRRDLSKLPPDPHLKPGALEVQRRTTLPAGLFNQCRRLDQHRVAGKINLLQRSGGKAAGKILPQKLSVVTQQNRADSSLSPRDHQSSQPAVADCITHSSDHNDFSIPGLEQSTDLRRCVRPGSCGQTEELQRDGETRGVRWALYAMGRRRRAASARMRCIAFVSWPA
jgi:hypothetical protein